MPRLRSPTQSGGDPSGDEHGLQAPVAVGCDLPWVWSSRRASWERARSWAPPPESRWGRTNRGSGPTVRPAGGQAVTPSAILYAVALGMAALGALDLGSGIYHALTGGPIEAAIEIGVAAYVFFTAAIVEGWAR